ncbi:MAG: alpha-E domain-containing protein, partial [Alphaproteobacteria bacterium]|nr:alpha-E domain-containing protein [Alphaproteobacteria bacterium]
LRSVSALGSYHWVYRDSIQPWNVAELLILRSEMPRSLCHCLDQVAYFLSRISEYHGHKYDCQRLAGKMNSELDYGNVDEIFEVGLHEYLTKFIGRLALLGEKISNDFHFYG